jgi:hypothetical protein
MKLAVAAFLLVLFFAPRAATAEEQRPLLLKPKAAIAAVTPHRSAPFVHRLGTPEPEALFTKHDPREEESRSSCDGQRDVCYEPGSGKIVYKPARNYMPDIPGLKRESMSIKRNRITWRYSF